MRVQRQDSYTLDAREQTPAGGMKADAHLTRTGVFRYLQADGSEFFEYRPPEEVFAADSLATLADAPVTAGHPKEPVTPANWKQYAIGHVTSVEPQRKDGKDASFIRTKIVVQDAAALADLESDRLIEVSMGYSTDLELTPGETASGERYDAIQRNIRYNHAALGPKNWGRAGNNVRVLDQAEGEPSYAEDMSNPTVKTNVQRTDETTTENTSRIATLEAELAAEKAKSAAIASERDAFKDLAKADRAPVATPAPKGPTDEEIAARIDSAVALRSKAASILGAKYTFAGKTDSQVLSDTIKAVRPTFVTDGKDAVALRAVFDLVCDEAQSAEAGTKAIREAGTETRADADDEFNKARAEYEARQKNAWKPKA